MATKLGSSSEVLSPGLLSGIPDSVVHWGIAPNPPSVRGDSLHRCHGRTTPFCSPSLCSLQGWFLKESPSSPVFSHVTHSDPGGDILNYVLGFRTHTQSSLVLPFLNLGIFDALVHLCKMTASQLSDIGVLQTISKNISTSPSVCSPGFLLIPRTFLFFFFLFPEQYLKKKCSYWYLKTLLISK